jgi:excisionase family DNA binding protein
VIIEPSPAAMTVKDFTNWTGLSRSSLYREFASGRIKALKVGKRTLIPTAEAQRWMAALPELQSHAKAA